MRWEWAGAVVAVWAVCPYNCWAHGSSPLTGGIEMPVELSEEARAELKKADEELKKLLAKEKEAIKERRRQKEITKAAVEGQKELKRQREKAKG